MKKLAPFAALVVATGLFWASAQGCSGGNDTAPIGDDSGGRKPGSSNGGSTDELPQGLSACNPTCDQDDECGDCPGDQTVCDKTQHVCIACGPNAGGKSCAAGKECTQYGYCVPQGTACAVDATGVPTITCADDSGCAACSSDYRVCNLTTKTCAKCNPGAAPAVGSLCQATEACSAQGTCEPKCPADCASDGVCSQCQDKGGPAAHVCTRGACSECNPTQPNNGGCGDGTKCGDNGACVPKCGDNGAAPLECDADSDCSNCSAAALIDNGAAAALDAGLSDAASSKQVVAWSCKKTSGADKGSCVPNLGGGDTGCKALGAQILPAPFDSVTALCDDDSACDGQGVSLNVGGLLGKITQLPGIGGGAMLYPMKRCAKMEILGNEIPCGICVPCKEDNDCQDINVIESVGSIFGPVGGLLSRVLESAIFGDDPPIIHMTCNKVFGDFGACVPCSSILTACGDKATAGTDGGIVLGDTCAGRTRGWYCSGINRATSYFCNGDGTQKSTYFCATPAVNCEADPSGNPKAKTVTPDAADPQSQDGVLPECGTAEDPTFPARSTDAGAGAPQGISP